MNYKRWLQPENFKITAFYPYTSIVQNRILSQSHNTKVEEHDDLEQFWNELWERAKGLGCVYDNKIALEIEPINISDGYSGKLFVGKKDGVISIGLSLWQPDNYTKKYNKTF